MITANQHRRLEAVRNCVVDYVALTKPRLTLLALFTTLAGFCVGSADAFNLTLLVHVLVGTGLLGGGAAALNHYLERHADARMPRTASRPLPAGRMRPIEAMVFGALLCLIGIIYLNLATNHLTAALGVLTVVVYLAIYVPLKQRTPWCTLVGAVPGALPPVLGYAAATNTIDAGAIILFAILFLWQIPHFFAIAMVYRDDYRAANMPMLPVVDVKGRRTSRQIMLTSLALLVATLWPTYSGIAGLQYLSAALFLGFIFGAFAFDAAVVRTPAAARRLFLASVLYLPLILAVMVWDRAPA